MRAIAFFLAVLAVAPQSGADRDASWSAFLAWFRTAPIAGNPLGGYAAKLESDGRTQPDIEKQMSLVRDMLRERTDWIGIYFDKVYRRPVTGDPEQDGFNTAPSALLVDEIKGLSPGAALDAGVGQGRNAVYLAKQGWAVTGFDISPEALLATTANAAKAGVQVTTVQASHDSFAFGSNRWDLIVLAFAWAPVTDPAFVARLRTSLRRGGRIVFEHFVRTADDEGPGMVRALKPNELRACFSDFRIARYEEIDGIGDWGGPGSHLVRMVAVKD